METEGNTTEERREHHKNKSHHKHKEQGED